MESRRDVFQAIADPTRRAIIGLIYKQSMTPNAIAEKFSQSRQAVSKHIQILLECGLVVSAQAGREIHYRIEVRKLKDVAEWLEPFRQVWEARFDNLERTLARIKTTGSGGKRKNKPTR